MPVRILIIDAHSARTQALVRTLAADELEVSLVVDDSEEIFDAVRLHNPDVILIDVDSPTRDTLEGLATLGRRFPRPILMLSESADTELVRQAARRGISMYALDDVSPSLLRSLLEVSTAHFQHWRVMNTELEEAQQALTDRRAIDQAKFRFAEAHGLSENDAYHRLRKMAMERGVKLGDLARQILKSPPEERKGP